MEAPASDFIDATAPTAPPSWPPQGAYPGEPGHPGPTPAPPQWPPAAPEAAEPGTAASPMPASPEATAVPAPPETTAAPASTDVTTAPTFADVTTMPGSTDVTTAPGSTDVTTAPGSTDVTTAPGSTDVTTAPGSTEVTAVVGEPLQGDALHGETVEAEVVWHQPPPTEPFHAKHEKPGEWHTHPPDHLAYQHSPPAEVQPGVQHDEPGEAIPLSMLPQPWQVPFDPHHTETVVTEDEPSRGGRRTKLWIPLALVVTLLLFGGGALSALMMLRNADSGKGSPDPATAVDRFLAAVYTEQDAASAGEHVCREARDEDKLQQRVDQIKGYANEYQAPTYRWTEPAVSGQDDEKATVAVQLTMTTDDEKSAQQQLTFTVVRKTGWLVCDITG
ncbi:hypothetical protein ACFOPG_02290 [Couchioplanes caeruleus subsp. azureus]